jgi:hypothetical protein
MNPSLMLSKWGRKLGKSLLKVKGKPTPKVETTRWNIVRGDLVQVIQGPQTGQQGKILEVIRKTNRVIIDGVNLVSNVTATYNSNINFFHGTEKQKYQTKR